MYIPFQQDTVGNLRKAKSQYTSRQQEYEKARDLANKAESESPAQSQGGPSVAAQVKLVK